LRLALALWQSAAYAAQFCNNQHGSSQLFGIGSTELLVILVVALIVLGPKSLASVSRSLGKAIGEFRRVSTDFQRTLNVEAAEDETRQAAAKKRETATKETADKNPAANPPKNASVENSFSETSAVQRDEAGPPPDSPLGQALAKAKEQAARPDAGPSTPGGTA